MQPQQGPDWLPQCCRCACYCCNNEVSGDQCTDTGFNEVKKINNPTLRCEGCFIQDAPISGEVWVMWLWWRWTPPHPRPTLNTDHWATVIDLPSITGPLIYLLVQASPCKYWQTDEAWTSEPRGRGRLQTRHEQTVKVKERRWKILRPCPKKWWSWVIKVLCGNVMSSVTFGY